MIVTLFIGIASLFTDEGVVQAAPEKHVCLVGDSKLIGLKGYVSSADKYKWFCTVSAGYNDWFTNKGHFRKNGYKDLCTWLKKANVKANDNNIYICMIILGSNDYAWYGNSASALKKRAQMYADGMNTLAKKYKYVQFAYVANAPVGKSSMQKKLDKFHGYVNKAIVKKKRENLSYFDPHAGFKKLIKKNCFKYLAGDRVHYTQSGNKVLWKSIQTVMKQVGDQKSSKAK